MVPFDGVTCFVDVFRTSDLLGLLVFVVRCTLLCCLSLSVRLSVDPGPILYPILSYSVRFNPTPSDPFISRRLVIWRGVCRSLVMETYLPEHHADWLEHRGRLRRREPQHHVHPRAHRWSPGVCLRAEVHQGGGWGVCSRLRRFVFLSRLLL